MIILLINQPIYYCICEHAPTGGWYKFLANAVVTPRLCPPPADSVQIILLYALIQITLDPTSSDRSGR